MDLRIALRTAAAELSDITDDPLLEARLIIQKATGLSRPVLLSHPELKLKEDTYAKFQELFSQRKQGIPLPYILGEWEFYGHSFNVCPSVLIPRPETELLVEQAAAWLKKNPDIRRGYDIGTGSGCIAISLLLAFPELLMTAADIKREALRIACSNAERHSCRERFSPIQSDLFSAFGAGAQLICANLPYIPTETCKTIEPARFEPLSALDGGADGFDLYRLLFRDLRNKIEEKCLILCEIEYRQRELALRTAESFFPDRSARVLDDLAGLPRLLRIE